MNIPTFGNISFRSFFKHINLFILLLIFSVLTLKYNYSSHHVNYKEFSLLEITQTLTLMTAFFIHLSCKRYFLKLSSNLTFMIRSFLLIFLFVEENSFLTNDLFPNLQLINHQSEVNFHNSSFAYKTLFQISWPFTNYTSSVSVIVFLLSISCIFLGCGLFLPYVKKFRYLFWEKQYAIFSFVYLANFFFSSLIRQISSSSFEILIDYEFVELFLYLIFLLDVIKKRMIMKMLYSKFNNDP
tara:strand:- start:213 stop:935 length:723 start_codon:yes stop_codon:yes gene_type:complete